MRTPECRLPRIASAGTSPDPLRGRIRYRALVTSSPTFIPVLNHRDILYKFIRICTLNLSLHAWVLIKIGRASGAHLQRDFRCASSKQTVASYYRREEEGKSENEVKEGRKRDDSKGRKVISEVISEHERENGKQLECVYRVPVIDGSRLRYLMVIMRVMYSCVYARVHTM